MSAASKSSVGNFTSRFTPICDINVQTFPVPHDAVDPVGFAFYHGNRALGFITDLGYATKMLVERLRQVHTLVIETNHDEKLLQSDPHRPWPVKQRIMSRHGHLSNAAAAAVLEELLPGKIERVVLGHLSRDCNTPDLACGAIHGLLQKVGADRVEVFCASQTEISPRFCIGQTTARVFQPSFDSVLFDTHSFTV
jgi:phosphoribosyl 1,2-cyclic phosphodiesterase